jgi:FAD/FMN-containing dehydrogenase
MTMTERTQTTWTNWAGNVRAEPREIACRESIEGLQAIVAEAARRGDRVRAAGSGHSFAPLCATDGVLIDLSRLSGVEAVDAETGEATILAGTKIHQIGEPLFQVGRGFANQGDIDRQAIAGAVSTGTHGTGRRYGSFSSAVRAVDLVGPDGSLVTIDASSPPDRLRAAALSLGMLGVVARVRLATVPAYKLRERTQALPFDACLEQYPAVEASHRNAEFWWIPPLDQCVLKTFAETGDEPFSVPEVEHPPGTIERYLKPEKVDWSHRVYPSSRSFPFVECEYTLPIANGPGAMLAVRDLMQRRHPEVRWGVEYRTQPGEHALLSPTGGEDAVTISVHQAANQPWEAFMRDCDALFREHGGRPHWGKIHWLDRAEVDRLYPEVVTFRSIRAEYDPDGVFLNDHLRPLLA